MRVTIEATRRTVLHGGAAGNWRTAAVYGAMFDFFAYARPCPTALRHFSSRFRIPESRPLLATEAHYRGQRTGQDEDAANAFVRKLRLYGPPPTPIHRS